MLQDGLPVSEQVVGNDYMKDPVSETFSLKDGVASWKSKAEEGSRKVSGPAFYASMYGPPIESALLARAALDRGGRMALLPDGEARISKVRELAAQAGDKSQPVTLFAVIGFDFSPVYLWLDAKREYFASGSTWQAVVREGWESAMPELIKAQEEASQQRAREQAQRLARRPRGKLVFHDASVFDAESARVVPHQDVVIDGNRTGLSRWDPRLRPQRARK